MGSDVKENKINDIKDGGLVGSFLGTSYLYWLEALSLMTRLTDASLMIIKLENWLQVRYPILFLVLVKTAVLILRRPMKVLSYVH